MYLSVKRFIDVTIAIIALIVLFPILVITAVFIKLDSKGPILFKQERLGRWGRPFQIYKFRILI